MYAIEIQIMDANIVVESLLSCQTQTYYKETVLHDNTVCYFQLDGAQIICNEGFHRG